MSSPTNTEEFEGFIKGITKPKLLQNLPVQSITVKYGDETFEIDIHGFNTIADLKLAIYHHFKRDSAAPNNQFLYNVLGPRVQPIDFSWVNKTLLPNPIKAAQNNEINYTFVSANGERENIQNNNYNDILIENKLNTDTIYLVLYNDLYNAIPGPKPLTDKQYYGILYQYFP